MRFEEIGKMTLWQLTCLAKTLNSLGNGDDVKLDFLRECKRFGLKTWNNPST